MTESNFSTFRYLENQSAEATFILLGFSEYPKLQVPLFLLFFTIYTVSVVGNLGMILVIKINPKLHTPMYYFLRHLSFIDFCNSTIVIPKLLENLVVEDRSITFPECMAQFTILCIFVTTEASLLSVMAYDRFVAVCNPLQYTTAMSQKLCTILVAASYFYAIFCSTTFCTLLMRLSFRGKNIINNFLCEYNAIVSVSYSDLHIIHMVMIAIGNINEFITLMIILTSYAYIFITVMKMPSIGGRKKAFSTCASHLTAITIFHGTMFFLYCIPNSKNSLLMFMVGNVFYIVVIPMLNPLIYGLRNKVLKETVRKVFHIKLSSDEI